MKLNFYRFTKGAKKDLVALNNRYTYSEIVGIVKACRKKDRHSPRLVKDELVITVSGKVIIGVSLTHLREYPRTHLFNCDVCFDSHHIKVGDTCDYCNGEGCDECDRGLIFNKISCPNCTSKNIKRSNTNEWSDTTKHQQQQRHGNGRRIPQKTKRHGRGKVGTGNTRAM